MEARFARAAVAVPFLGAMLGLSKERQMARINAGRTKPGGLNCSAMPADAAGLARLVTVLLASSPRPEDAEGLSLPLLQRALRTAWDTLGLHGARTVVMFDGRAPNVGEAAWRHYQEKIANVRAWAQERGLSSLEVFESPAWGHKAQTLRRALALGPRTPFLFLLEDDGWLVGRVDTAAVLWRLGCDRRVDYVKLLWDGDCAVGGLLTWYARPCRRHPDAEWLHSTHSYSDRPHFATRNFYEQTVLPAIPPDARGVPEDFLMWRLGARGSMWLYGRRGRMRHDRHTGQHAYNGHEASLAGALHALAVHASLWHPF